MRRSLLFLGTANSADFDLGRLKFLPVQWSLSRFILHYAALCKFAGGVESFCIGSEFRGLTRDSGCGQWVRRVERLRGLAAEVRVIPGRTPRSAMQPIGPSILGISHKMGPEIGTFILIRFGRIRTSILSDRQLYAAVGLAGGQRHLMRVGSIYEFDYLRWNIKVVKGMTGFITRWTPKPRKYGRRSLMGHMMSLGSGGTRIS